MSLKLDDVILYASASAALYLGYRYVAAQSTQPRAMYVRQNPASPYAQNGRPLTYRGPVSTINDRMPSINQAAQTPGFIWNDEAGRYMNRDSENVVEYLDA